MKKCELCKSAATISCESDQASLCWDCDAGVHSANFLVAKHSRTLLCRVCQSPTPWNASGYKLCRTATSVCQSCVDKAAESTKDDDEVEIDVDYDECDELFDQDEDDDGGDRDEAVEVETETETENQVVTVTASLLSSEEESSSTTTKLSNGDGAVSLKRLRENGGSSFCV